MTVGAIGISMLVGCKSSDTTSGQTAELQSTTAAQTTIEVQEEDGAGTSQNAENIVETDKESTDMGKEGVLGGKILVVYYSASGHTKDVANVIADETGADLFELEPIEPYTSDDLNYRDENSRVSQEHENEEQRKVELVSVEAENWDSYETVFIGYPIWWGIAAWPVDSFVEANDFTGKNVIPFCTSASSGLGESGELLEKKQEQEIGRKVCVLVLVHLRKM